VSGKGNSFGLIVEGFFRRNGGWTRIKGELSVYYWPRIAGSELANKVEAVQFREGYLYLQTENPALAHQISLMNYDIIKKYQKVLGPGIIKGIKIRIRATSGRLNSLREEKKEILLNSEEETLINSCCQKINDPELADKFNHFMKISYLSRKEKQETGGHSCPSCGTVISLEFRFCPCCERRVKEEMKDYMNYLKKNVDGKTNDVVKEDLENTNLFLIDQVLKSNKRG
jgi:hypothetical protein